VLVRALSRARTAAAAGPAHASSGTHGIPLDLACVIVSGTALFIRYMPMWTGTRCVYRYRCSSSKPNTLFVGYLSGLSSLCCAADALKSREDKKICRLSHCIWAKGGQEPSLTSTGLPPLSQGTRSQARQDGSSVPPIPLPRSLVHFQLSERLVTCSAKCWPSTHRDRAERAWHARATQPS
jgi:hypothetical protein